MSAEKTPETPCINLEFSRSESLSKQTKVKEFWKYLDGQDILRPYESVRTMESRGIETCSTNSRSVSEASLVSKLASSKIRQNTKKDSKPKKCTDETCKIEKYLREDLRYADSVEVPYEEIKAEIEAYQRRLLKCKNPYCKNDWCDCYKKKTPKE